MANYPVPVLPRVPNVGTSSFYDGRASRVNPSSRAAADAELTEKIPATTP